MEILTVKIVELKAVKEAQKLGCETPEAAVLVGKDLSSGENYQIAWDAANPDEKLEKITSLLGVSSAGDAKDLSVRIAFSTDGDGALRIGHATEDRWVDVDAGGLTNWS